VIGAFTGIVAAAPALASPVYPPFCEVPPRLLVTPRGDATLVVTVRDADGELRESKPITVDLSHCPGLRFATCPDCDDASPYDPIARTLTLLSNRDGMASFRLCGSVLCDESSGAAPVIVHVRGMLLRSINVATTDLTADGLVDAADLAVWDVRSALGDRIGDYDGDGDLDDADRAFLTTAVGEHCDAALPIQATTWGRLKAIHR
jgi:hypothetical protein